MIPNTQFPLNPAAQPGTNQQVNNWVDHTAQGMPQFQGGPVMQPLNTGAPIAQPLATTPDGQPIHAPNPNAGPAQPHEFGDHYVGSIPHNPTPETMPFYDASLPDQGRSLYQDAVDAWRGTAPPRLGLSLSPGMTSQQRYDARTGYLDANSAWQGAKPQWIVRPDSQGHSHGSLRPDEGRLHPWAGQRWPGANG